MDINHFIKSSYPQTQHPLTKLQIRIPKKSSSLPRIQPLSKINKSEPNTNLNIDKNHEYIVYQKKPLYQYHRINWSVTPKCLIRGHQGSPIIYLCVDNNCQHLSRLICQNCFYKDHKVHNKKCIAIDQIKNADIMQLRYWPFEKEYKQIHQFLKRHEKYIQNLIQDIRASFENLLERVNKTIKETEKKYIQKVINFYHKESTKKQFISKLTKQMNQAFQIKSIHNLTKQIFSKELRHDVFTSKMTQLLKNTGANQKKQKLMQYFGSPETDKGFDMEFDKVYFIKRQKIIVQSINDILKALNQKQVVVDKAAIGLQQIITQVVTYLNQNSHPYLSSQQVLTFKKKKLDDGSIYHGFFYGEKRVLLGMKDYRNGYIYYGEWKNNSRSGWGAFENKQLSYKYSGFWKQDRKCGFGKEQTLTYTYQGQFQNDKKQGFGTIIQGKVRYDITWKDDKKNGKGKKLLQDGKQKVVYYLNGIESKVKDNSAGDKSHKDVTFLAQMFAKNKKTTQ